MAKKSPRKITYVTLSADESIHPKYEAALKKFEGQLGRHYPIFIGKSEVNSDAGEFEHRSPIDTSIVVGHFQVGTSAHAREAVDEAAKGFAVWSSTPWRERLRILERAAKLIDERKFEIAVTITYEVGKNRLEALAECWEAADAIKYYAKIMREENGYEEKMGQGGPGERSKLVSKPLGVWPVISPFNFPFMLAGGMALGALITGNSVILKPTSEAPLTGLMLYKVYRDAGVPAGAVNYVTGPGANFEEEFVSNPSVAGIAFTGSRDVGMRLYRGFLTRQQYPKPILLEMGSKNPTIVTARADITKAVEGTVRAAYGYGGQKCSATSRVYVQARVRDNFLDALSERIGKLKVGDPREKDVFMGPIINESAVKRFEAAVQEAKEAGGQVLTGGAVIRRGSMARGYYVAPTVIVGLPSGHRLFKDELFVPLVAVDGFDRLDEAIAKANETEYGLYGGVWTSNLKTAHELASRLQCGVVAINEFLVTFPQTPFGGYKESGLGHENGIRCLQYYTRTKNVSVNLA